MLHCVVASFTFFKSFFPPHQRLGWPQWSHWNEWRGSFHTHTQLCWSEHSSLFFPSVSLSSLYLQSSDPSTPRVPKPVNQQIVNEGPSSKTHREAEKGETKGERRLRAAREGGVLDQLSVCQNMSTRLSLCLSSPLMWVPQWAPRKDHNTAFAPRVSLSCSIKSEREGDRETARECVREINYMFQ